MRIKSEKVFDDVCNICKLEVEYVLRDLHNSSEYTLKCSPDYSFWFCPKCHNRNQVWEAVCHENC